MSTIPRPGNVVEPRPWQTGLAPVYIGMFLWVGFFDQIGRRALPLGGLWGSLLGVAVAGLLGYFLLFRVPATWGFRVGKPLEVVAASTFGSKGAPIVPGFLIGLVQVVLFAVAVDYAVGLTFQGLVALRLVGEGPLRPTSLGRAEIRGPLYLTTALFWAVATALVSLRFVRWIAYLMQYFPIFPALILGAAAMVNMVGLREFRPTGLDPFRALSAGFPAVDPFRASLLTLQWTFGFSALAGLIGADWGSGTTTIRDVKVGGWIGMALAPLIVATLAMIAVAGSEGSRREEPPDRPIGNIRVIPSDPAIESPPYTFRALMTEGIERHVGGVMLLIFGLASLGPALFSAFLFGQRFKALGPGASLFTWTMLGTCTAWLLIIGRWFDRSDVAFDLVGAAFAPVAGAIAADYRRTRGRWPGPRAGVNPAGLIAWTIGAVVGLLPGFGRALHVESLARFQPASVAAFVAAYLAYELAASAGLESAAKPPAPGPGWESDGPPEAGGITPASSAPAP